MKTNKNLSLKESFMELEQISQELESTDIDLEESIPKFKRGLELAKYLKHKLLEVENEIVEIKAKFEKVDNQTQDDLFNEEN